MRDARIVATGTELLRAGVRGFEPVVQELIQEAQAEIQIVAYVFTPSARNLLEALGNAADLGIRVDIVVNRLDRQASTIKAWLKSVPPRWSNFRVFDFVPPGRRELHAKVCVADRKRGVIGSANFTWGGLVSNYEVGVEVEGRVAWELAGLVDELASMARPLTK